MPVPPKGRQALSICGLVGGDLSCPAGNHSKADLPGNSCRAGQELPFQRGKFCREAAQKTPIGYAQYSSSPVTGKSHIALEKLCFA
jgi:hypothetical protein